jgi:hypothetical protein
MPEPILCYVSNGCAYFTLKPLSEQWGDDWNDAPYEHNAGPPYDPEAKVYFECGPYLEEPCEGQSNSEYTVQRINTGEVPWLRQNQRKDGVSIYAGCTLSDFKRIIRSLPEGAVYTKELDFSSIPVEVSSHA